MNRENFVISRFGVKSRFIGDDAAIVGKWLYSQDAFFENVHFKRAWMSLYQIGYKAMIINLSDAIAMHATPKYALLTLALPKYLSQEEIAELTQGIQSAADSYGCEIIGGDTIANIKIDISITVISQSKKPLRRNGFRQGDILAYTGDIGRSKKDLTRLFQGQKISSKARFITPVLKEAFVKRSIRHLSGGMDISDGLYEDAKKMTRMKGMTFKPWQRIAKRKACSGEEYEMLVSFSPRAYQAIKRSAAQSRTKITSFATIKRGSINRSCKPNHF